MSSTPEIAQSCVTKMQEAAATFHSSLKGTKVQAPEQQPTREQQKTLADGIKLEASKIGLIWGNTAPTPAEAEPLLSALEQRHSQFLTLMYIISSGTGPTLQRLVKDTAAPITASCVDLITFLSSNEPVPEGQAAVKTGVVMAACDKASRTNLDNQHAFGRLFVAVCRRVKDTAREVKELVDEASADCEPQNAGTATGRSCDSGDLDFEELSLSSSEHALAKSSVRVVNAVVDICKMLLKTLLARPVLSENVDLWESLLFHVQKLGDLTNDLGAALYAPQDQTEIAEIGSCIQVCCDLIIDEVADGVASGQDLHRDCFLRLQDDISSAVADLT